MTFRTRLVLASTAAVVIAVLLAASAAFLVSRNSLLGSLDDSLALRAATALHQGELDYQDSAGFYGELSCLTGESIITNGCRLPVNDRVRQVAAGSGSAYFATVDADGTEYRELVTPVPVGTQINDDNNIPTILPTPAALQLATPMTGVNSQLAHLGVALAAVAVGGVAVSILLGWAVSRATLGPLNDLTDTVEDVAETTDVSRRLDPRGVDELGRLRRAFNRLLEAVETSREAQRQLVLDASHELRTPLTSLRTNLEVVRRVDELEPADREVLVADVLTQMGELTQLVGDLAELARGESPQQQAAVLRLDQLVDDAVAIAATHARHRGVHFETALAPTWVNGQSERITRAVGNLLDNALKWSPDGAVVEVSCARGTVTVRDHGPGIDPEDLPHVFDRFYRAPAARALPGSGLGLAIVSQVVAAEGGTVTAGPAPGGGTVFEIRLPEIPGVESLRVPDDVRIVD